MLLNGILRVLRKRNRFRGNRPGDLERAIAKLPQGGRLVSVEKALNSRCCSDHDAAPGSLHWGTFDLAYRLSDEQVSGVIDAVETLRLTRGATTVRGEGNLLTFLVNADAVGDEKLRLMVESGMQQQAAALVCAALGIGVVFQHHGRDGLAPSPGKQATISMKLEPMTPPYDGAYWTAMAPDKREAWQEGNLTDPDRAGTRPLLDVLATVTPQSSGSSIEDVATIGQILWAARGNTPHTSMSKLRGMTIPVWAGERNISRVYLVADSALFAYRNLVRGKATHSVRRIGTISREKWRRAADTLELSHCSLILGTNERSGRAFWEVGYQLLNVTLEAEALGLSYRVIMIEEGQRQMMREIGVRNATALVVFEKTHSHLMRDYE